MHPSPPYCCTLTLPNILYASIYMQYILLPPPTCFSVPTLLTPVTVTILAQCIPTKLFFYVSCILCTSTKCMLCTTLVVSLPLLPHNPPLCHSFSLPLFPLCLH